MNATPGRLRSHSGDCTRQYQGRGHTKEMYDNEGREFSEERKENFKANRRVLIFISHSPLFFFLSVSLSSFLLSLFLPVNPLFSISIYLTLSGSYSLSLSLYLSPPPPRLSLPPPSLSLSISLSISLPHFIFSLSLFPSFSLPLYRFSISISRTLCGA